jgi:hypothetical protein
MLSWIGVSLYLTLYGTEPTIRKISLTYPASRWTGRYWPVHGPGTYLPTRLTHSNIVCRRAIIATVCDSHPSIPVTLSGALGPPIMVSFPNGTPLWQEEEEEEEEEEWCMNESVVIKEMWRLPKKTCGRNTEIDLISLCICVWGRMGATIVCDERQLQRTNKLCSVWISVQAIVWTLEAGGVRKRGLGFSWLG